MPIKEISRSSVAEPQEPSDIRRKEIEQQVAEFLKKGGKIYHAHPSENATNRGVKS